MILTNRQKKIIALLLNGVEGISIKDIETRIKISRRTIYREFNELRSVLVKQDVKLSNKNGVYYLNGSTAALKKLMTVVKATAGQNSMSVATRENALAAYLLLDNTPKKIIQFALDLGVSESTIQKDLDIVEESLLKYHLTLNRKKGVGIFISGQESYQRQVLIGILLNEINDYDFFYYLTHEEDITQPFLKLLPKTLVKQTQFCLQDTIFNEIKINSDHQTIALILTFAVSMYRIQNSYVSERIILNSDSLKYQGLVYRFMSAFNKFKTVQVTANDVNYLASKIMSTNVDQCNIKYNNDDDLAISIKVKEFIKVVSKQVHWDFQRNPNFNSRLFKHITGLINHQFMSLPNTEITTLSELSKRFKKLYQAIDAAWSKVFVDTNITNSEMQLLLLYFANEYTSWKSNQQYNALIICENGIGTSAILRTRLKQELPEIKQIELSRVSALSELNLQKYDIILSTLELNGFARDYLLVSPLLLNDEINKIKNYLKNYKKEFAVLNNANNPMLKQASKQLINVAKNSSFCVDLINNIRVKKLDSNTDDLMLLIQECLADIESNIISDKITVANKILARIKLAPVGIPNSSLALLHTSSSEIKRCVFLIYDLANAISLKAMDGTEILIKRLLLMLAPAKLSNAEQEVMSMISSMIIMNDDNLQLFSNANQEKIKNLIANQYLIELKAKINNVNN